jgi:branched-chain amino acid transport system permease protein
MRKRQNMKSPRKVWLLMTGLAVVALFLPLATPPFLLMLLTQAIILAIAAMSLDMLIGYTDLGSLGHSGFLAIGAYTTALLSLNHGSGLLTTLCMSVLIVMAASALLGLVALRATGLHFLLITLAAAMCIWGLIYRWVSVTGGENGLSGIQKPDIGVDLNNPTNFFYFILILFAFCTQLMVLIIKSPFGKTLVGIRDSESRMKVLGYNVWLHKYLIFIVASGFAGVAGCLYAYYNGFVSPTLSDLGHCMGLVLMVCIGGPGTLVGAILGALIIVSLENVVSIFTQRWLMVLAAVYVISAMYAPTGLLGLLRKKEK